MKRIAKALVIVALASSAVAATAADVPYPSAGADGYFQSQVFPNIDTWKREHRDSVATEPSTAYPSAAQQEYSLYSEFPNTPTYQSVHANDPAPVSSAPFPFSVPPEGPSMADEGLVPGIAGVAPYVANPQEGAVGATR